MCWQSVKIPNFFSKCKLFITSILYDINTWQNNHEIFSSVTENSKIVEKVVLALAVATVLRKYCLLEEDVKFCQGYDASWWQKKVCLTVNEIKHYYVCLYKKPLIFFVNTVDK